MGEEVVIGGVERDPGELAAEITRGLRRAVVHRVAEELAAKEPLDTGEFLGFFESLPDESDRAIPIVAFAYLDSLFSKLLVSELNPNVTGGPESIVRHGGPLDSAGSRFKVAQAIYWMDDESANDLSTLRKIRNLFAHEPQISFEDSRVQGHVSNLKQAKRALDAIVAPTSEAESLPVGHLRKTDLQKADFLAVPLGPRTTFIFGMAVTSSRVIIQMHLTPTALRAGVSVGDVLALPDLLPEDVVAWQEMPRRLLNTLLFTLGIPVAEPSD